MYTSVGTMDTTLLATLWKVRAGAHTNIKLFLLYLTHIYEYDYFASAGRET